MTANDTVRPTIADTTARSITADQTAKIAERAYRLWESEGPQHGRAIDHWLRAEAELAAHLIPRVTAVEPKPSMVSQLRSTTKQS